MPTPDTNYFDLFLKYAYSETKDLCKHFLTVVTTILVFSLTFSEKIVDYKTASTTAKTMLIVTWGLFVFAIIACGIGLCFNALAGGQAVNGLLDKQAGGLHSGGIYHAVNSYSNKSYLCIISAGVLFVLALICLVVIAIVFGNARKS